MSHDFVDRAAPLLHAMLRAPELAIGAEAPPAWDDAPEWQRQSALVRVMHILSSPDEAPTDATDAICRATILALAGDEELLVNRHSGADPARTIVAEHIVDCYSITPIVAQDGALSLHFEGLGVTIATEETLQIQAQLFIDPASRVANPDGVTCWRNTLALELEKADAALARS